MQPNDSERKAGTEESSRTRPNAIKALVTELLLRAGGTILLLWIMLTFVVGVYVNHGNEGYPMLKDGDLCITYRLADVRPGDAVMYRNPDGQCRCGRVAASAGDQVEISGSTLLVNGFTAPVESFYPTSAENGVLRGVYTVPQGCVFIVNDCRVDGKDSRTYGGIPLGNCRGKIILVVRRRGI